MKKHSATWLFWVFITILILALVSCKTVKNESKGGPRYSPSKDH